MTLMNADDVGLTSQGTHIIRSQPLSRQFYVINSFLQASGKVEVLHCKWDEDDGRLGKDGVGDNGTVLGGRVSRLRCSVCGFALVFQKVSICRPKDVVFL